jgi:hypothetical protein
MSGQVFLYASFPERGNRLLVFFAFQSGLANTSSLFHLDFFCDCLHPRLMRLFGFALLKNIFSSAFANFLSLPFEDLVVVLVVLLDALGMLLAILL